MIIKNIMSKPMVRKSGIVFIGNVISQGFALLFMIFAARILSKEDYGYVSYILSMGNFFMAIACGGFHIGTTRYIAKDPSKEREYISNAIFGILILFLSVSIIIIIFLSYIEIIFIVFSITLMILYLSILQGKRLFKMYAFVNAIRNILKFALLLILLYLGMVSKYSVIWIYFSVGILVILFIDSKLKLITLPKYNPIIFKRLLKFSFPVMIANIFYSLTSTIGIYIIHIELGDTVVAVYKNTLLLLLMYSFITGAIGTVLLPKIASLKSPSRIKSLLLQSITFTLMIQILIFIGMILIGKFVIVFLFSKKYVEIYDLFLIMSFGAFASSTRNLFSQFWKGIGRTIVPMVDIMIAGLFITFLTLIFIPSLGVFGVCYAYSIGFSLAVFVDILFYLYYKSKGVFTEEKIHR